MQTALRRTIILNDLLIDGQNYLKYISRIDMTVPGSWDQDRAADVIARDAGEVTVTAEWRYANSAVEVVPPEYHMETEITVRPMRTKFNAEIPMEDRLFMRNKVTEMMTSENHDNLFEPGSAIPEVTAAPTPVATAQATLTGVGATIDTDNAETTQVTPVDLEDDAEEEERAQATPHSLDVEMPSADEQQVYVKEEHLPEWILTKIQSQHRATLEMEHAILKLIAQSQGLTPP